MTELLTLGVDPGAESTGLCLVSGRAVEWTTTMHCGSDATAYVHEVLGMISGIVGEHSVGLVAVEDLTAPTAHIRIIDPRHLVRTAVVLGAVVGYESVWDIPVQRVPPGHHGSAVYGQYPPELVSAHERQARGWQHRLAGDGVLRHQRSAYDVARMGERMHRGGKRYGR